jgi:thiol-disulfide isomerase/thioredoxin
MADAAGKNQTKQQRRRAAAEAREEARRRQAQRRALGYILGGVALIAIVVLTVLAFMGGDDGAGPVRIQPVAAGRVTASGSPRTEPLAAGETVPSFSAPGFRVATDPDTGDLAVQRQPVSWEPGTPTVVSIWAPWCPHCQAELPVLSRVMQDFPGVDFVTVVTSINDSPGPDAGTFLKDNGVTAPTAIDDVDGTLAQAFGIQAFPTLYFVGSDGAVVQELEGEVDEATLRDLIGSLS